MTTSAPLSPKPLADASLDEIEDELARRNLIAFTLRTKADYQAGWFHREVGKALDQFLDDLLAKRSPRLIITAPPQHGKSELTSRRLPAVAFGKHPDLRIVGTAYSADLAESFSADIQKIIDTPEYSHIYPSTRILAEGAKNAREKRRSEFFTIVGKKGNYRAVGRGGALTGHPADLVIVDDPLKDFDESMSEVIRESSWNWLVTVVMSRLQEGGGAIVMATRWNQDDIIGRLQRHQPGKWTIVNFPAIAEEDEPYRRMGETLSVERFSQETMEEKRDGGLVNSYQWAAIYQQHPSPLGGGIFKRSDWRFWDISTPPDFDEILQSWDCTFKDTKGSDMVAGQVWGYKGAHKYLIDRVNDRMTFGATKTAIRTLTAKHPATFRKFIEDKANGPAVIDDLTGEISGMIAVEPMGGKISRAHAVSGEVEAHNVWLPATRDLETGALVPLPWVHDFIEQHAAFPTGTHDDDVDACTQALAQIRRMNLEMGLVDYMKQIKNDMAKVTTSTLQKPETNQKTEGCPACGSTMIVRMGGQKKCNNCTHQWGGSAPAPGGQRREFIK